MINCTTANDEKNNSCIIKITDNGIRFDNKDNERIFGLFQRLHGRNEYEGTGIGLAICKKIVEQHRGVITASGKQGEGAIFYIELPLQSRKTENPTT